MVRGARGGEQFQISWIYGVSGWRYGGRTETQAWRRSAYYGRVGWFVEKRRNDNRYEYVNAREPSDTYSIVRLRVMNEYKRKEDGGV